MAIAHELIQQCVERVQAGREHSFLLLLPTASLVEQASRQILSASGRQGLAGLPVHSFDAFIDQVIRSAQRPVSLLADREREVLISGLVKEMGAQGSLTYFARIAEMPGLAWSLANSIAELKLAAVSPEKLSLALNEDDHPKLLELAVIYCAYQRVLQQRGFIDKEDRYRLVAELLIDQPQDYLAGVDLFLADHFYDLTPVQGEIFQAIRRYVGASTIHFGYVDPSRTELSQVLERSLLRLEHGGIQFAAPESPSERPALRHLAQQLYRRAAPVSDDAQGIAMLVAPDPEREITQVAKQIKRRVLAGELQPWEAAVVIRDPATYQGLVAKVFTREGVPCRINQQEALAANPLVQAVLLWLSSAESEPQGFSLERLLKCDLLMRDAPLAQRVATLWPTLGLTGTWVQWLERLAQLRERAAYRARYQRVDDSGESELPPEDHSLYSQAESLLRDLQEAMAALPKEAIPSCFGRALLQSLARLGLERNLRRGLIRHPGRVDRAHGDEQRLRLLGRDYAAWQELSALIADLPRVLALWSGEEPVLSLREYIAQLRLMIDPASYQLPVGHPAGVMVGSPSQLRGQTFRSVAVVGLQDQSFPRAIRPDWIVTDHQRQRLERFGISLDRSWDLYQREKFLFFLAATSAVEELWLCHASSDLAGQAQLPSPFLREVEQLFTQGSIHRQELPSHELILRDPLQATHAGEFYQSLIRGLARSSDPEEAVLALAPLLQAADDWPLLSKRLAAELSRSLPVAGIYDGRVDDPALKQALAKRLGEQALHSISSLGQYALCPFTYLSQRQLRVEPLPELEEELSPLTRGNLVHHILWQFFDRHRQESLAASRRGEYLLEMKGIIDQQWAQLPMQSPHPLLWAMQRQRIEEEMTQVIDNELRLVEAHGGLIQPRLLEWGFGLPLRPGMDPASVAEPLVVQGEAGPVRIVGLIDRVDASQQGQVVVYDYKTGMAPGMEDLWQGINLQLPVYTWAVEQLSPVGRQPVAAAFYELKAGRASRGLWSEAGADQLKVGAANGGRLSEDQWHDMMKQLKAKVGRDVEGMRHGQFTTTPRKKCPSYCQYRELCRFDPRRGLTTSPTGGETP